MPKQIYCERCGAELQVSLKALPTAKRVITVITPHTCEENFTNPFEGLDKPIPLTIEEPKPSTPKTTKSLFDDFPKIVSKQNDLSDKSTVFDKALGDKRPKEDISQSFLSSTPPGIKKAMKTLATSDTEGLPEE